MINVWMAQLIEELQEEGVDDPLARPMMLAALWSDLCRQAGELPSAVLSHYLGDEVASDPVLRETLGTAASGATEGTSVGVAHLDALLRAGDEAMSPIQDLYFALMARSSFNDFDGPQVVRDLQARPAHWHAAVMVGSNLDVQLRDLPLGVSQIDTLYLATDESHVEAFEDLAGQWRAASVERCRPGPGLGFGGWATKDVVLRLWWD